MGCGLPLVLISIALRHPECTSLSWIWPSGGPGVVFFHDDVIKWKRFARYWPFARGIHRSQVNSPHKGQWRRTLMFSSIYAWIKGWVNNRKAGDLRHHSAHYDVTLLRRLCFVVVSFHPKFIIHPERRYIATKTLVNKSSDNGLLSDGTKTPEEQILLGYYWYLLQIHRDVLAKILI